MGLNLEVGILADLKENDAEAYSHFVKKFEDVNEVLRCNGLEEHAEPDEVEEFFTCEMLGHSGLHFLRRIGMHLALGDPLPAPGDWESCLSASLIRTYGDRFERGEALKYQHLIMHSDAEGFYLPRDFERVLEAPVSVGGWIGSTQRLRAECTELAGFIGIPAELHWSSEEILAAVDAQLRPSRRSSPRWWRWKSARHRDKAPAQSTWVTYGVETCICLRLLDACEVSSRTKAAITFV